METIELSTHEAEEPDPRPSIGIGTAALAGVLCAGAGLGFAELIAGSARSLQSPVLDVGDRVVDNVPGPIKDVAIDLFGTNDKIALLVGIGITLLIASAIAGVVALRRKLALAIGAVAVFGLIAAGAAVATRTGYQPARALPTLFGTALTAGSLWWLRDRVHCLGRSTESAAGHADRRRFLGALGGVAVLGAGFAILGRRLGSRFSASASRDAVVLPGAGTAGSATLDQTIAAPDGVQAPGAASFYTPNDEFYRIDTALSVPQVDAESWSLDITGMVDSPYTVSYDELLDIGLVESDITLTCVSNTVGGELMGTARWIGVRLDELLDRAGIDASADQIVGRSVDGYTCGFPVSTLDGRDALVAVGMNGEPLPLEHGFPARLIVPGLYGYVSATKWLREIELTTFDAFDHYWVPRGYAAEAPIKLQSRIDTPRGLDRIDRGPFVIGGVAWAQTIGIDRVELSIDEGPWVDATLADELNDTTWRQWSHAWDATPGRHSITVRATDRNGTVQTADRAEPLPDGATGHHTVVVLVNE